MSGMRVPDQVDRFLGCPTSERWVGEARENIDVLLLDHANCELKAASTAMSLMFQYPQREKLVHRMSRLAREELRHFEQVRALIAKRGIAARVIPASSYAAGLKKAVSTTEPGRLVDTLIVGAFIEARSCERFARLSPVLDPELAKFYRGLLAAESRHFEHYVALARAYSPFGDAAFAKRVGDFRQREAELVSASCKEIRFHSGPLMTRSQSLLTG